MALSTLEMAGGEAGFIQMEREKYLLVGIASHRIAAPPAGVPAENALYLFAVGGKYKRDWLK